MSGDDEQACSTPGCGGVAAFRTRTRPAWCQACIARILDEARLTPAGPFPGKPDKPWLMACLVCGITAHTRLSYVVDKLGVEPVCRACFWSEWVTGTWPTEPLDVDLIVSAVAASRRELVQLLHDPPTASHPIVVRCLDCGLVEVTRPLELHFGCVCSRNARSRRPGDGPDGRVRLHDSGLDAVGWWDPECNDEEAFRVVTTKATREAAWRCPECGHRFKAKVVAMANHPQCPVCSEIAAAQRQAQLAEWHATPIAAVPELLSAWADDRDPMSVMVGEAAVLYKFRCPVGHLPAINPLRFLEAGCPHCRAAKTRTRSKTLADLHPELASQWHPTRNGQLRPADLVWDSTRVVWWRTECCGAEWQQSPRDRDKYQRTRCPKCRSILGSLAWQDPGLAMEWSPRNPIDAWHVRPTATTDFVPKWVCAIDPAHRWEMSLTSRSTGAGCPECRESGKSRIELDHFDAAHQAFGSARSGVALRNAAFTTRTVWTADVLVDVDDVAVVIEYDGAYWHQGEAKRLIDERKSRDLLAAGYRVVRLREDRLAMLELEDPALLQLRVYSGAPDPAQVMNRVRAWLSLGRG